MSDFNKGDFVHSDKTGMTYVISGQIIGTQAFQSYAESLDSAAVYARGRSTMIVEAVLVRPATAKEAEAAKARMLKEIADETARMNWVTGNLQAMSPSERMRQENRLQNVARALRAVQKLIQ